MFSDGKLYLRETGEFNETNLFCSILRGQVFVVDMQVFAI